ncbi:MAG: hypothetical protein COU63_01010 [Candidatus Pacebacteria bacterium CG10_big_fil_rev_8_21_14_0_10_36_11]|nr:glycosyltransferase family 4 protein [Candidatus Pacearchaeota archaeon]OIP74597.1 MAG: hypothetical protein AUK08_00610 [Candidatus Pacebacteria bacterium CG2_30_36_39]PIR65225.1 MAG: hypothetical protein COU63_01010 [Candidatus Pacebacteria bacterium CG10_big_fil_rev_8_21_14_0_10_36_11]PJC42557.1 MAG: hypothetical protein CO040_03795 [Candidatus Pacebacteria bacterium CG_4_9_14_0_2_um_filter_36_8]
MKIGIDFTPTIYDRGVSRYTKNLIRSLMEQPGADLALYGSSFRQNEILKNKAQEILSMAKPVGEYVLKVQNYPPTLLSILWKLGLNPIKKILPDIDVFHSWDWLQPPDKDLPLVSTIHDLAILKYPETAHPKILAAHQQSWKVLRERDAEIITVSQATKRDIIEFLGIPAYRITVIPEALPYEIRLINERLTEEQSEQIKQRLVLTRPYILFVGTREPRKNLKRLIEAWEGIKDEVDLLIAGETGWDESGNYQIPGLRFLGKVTDIELNVLYAEAEAFAYPSLDEGFGLPILEAFYHGTPVITADLPVMLEVAGNAAQLVDPENVQSIRQGIEIVLNENTEEQRTRLQRMIIRMHMFSWHLVAEQTLEVYAKAIERYGK